MSADFRLSEKQILLLILSLAVAVRLWGITFDLPYVYHTDEARFADIATKYFKGDLNPHFFHVPTLYTYLVAGVWGIYFLVGKALGEFTTIASFLQAFVNDPSIFILLGRLITVVLSVGTVWLVYLTGRRMYGPRVGVLAALFLIFSPEHNRISHYMNPDAPMVFFQTLSFFFIWQIYKRGKPRDYLLAGLTAGLAFGTKYGGQMLFIPLFLAHLFRVLENNLPRRRFVLDVPLVASGLLFLAAFLAVTPYAALDFPRFWEDFRWQSQHLYTLGHYGSAAQPALLFYLRYGFRENIGTIAQALVLGGAVFGLVRHRRREIVLLSFPLVLFAIVSSWKAYATRYMLPLAPFLALIAAFFLDRLIDTLASRPLFARRSRLKAAAVPAFVFLILVPSLLTMARFGWGLTHPDTRTLAKRWIDAHIPPRAKIILEAYHPPLDPERYRLTYRQPSLSAIDLDWLAQKRMEYAIVSELIYGRFVPYPEEFPKEARFYASLDEKAVLLKTFRPRFREDLITMHNPTIKVYKLSPCPDPSFPGNFSAYGQAVSFRKTAGNVRVVQSRAASGGIRKNAEKVGLPYVRILDPGGREIFRFDLQEERPARAGRSIFSGTSKPFPLPEGTTIVVGYGYELFPAPASLESPLRKETVLAGPGKAETDILFLYAALPRRRGEEYFQTVTLDRSGESWRLSSTAYGGELRWGDDFIRNPFVIITDAGGREVRRMVLFQGKVGSRDADIPGPISKTEDLGSLPQGFRVFIGYEYYFDATAPEKAGGPEMIELAVPSLERAAGSPPETPGSIP